MPAGDMVLYATHKFGEAHTRWEMHKRFLICRIGRFGRCLAAFWRNTFRKSSWAKEDEFLRLKGKLSVVSIELSHYAPFMVEDEERNVDGSFKDYEMISRHLSTGVDNLWRGACKGDYL
ncbi:hypothetical protein Nepgr_006613 [Nepenthes gracilis]|uniref:Uncharacterized protein n=1 Tax=Nepenthes gracilis TaxID=150966 RepID=A0AAD3S5C8_NEPGR|nr:hypothetical protein Nepgr_006613 [Nepenthes gracilis]